MSITGYGLTLSGAEVGSISGIKSITVGDLVLDTERIRTCADTNRLGTANVLHVTQEPTEIRCDWNKTVHSTLRAKALARTSDTFTLTDSEGSTDVGTAFVTRVGGRTLGTDGHAEFTFTLEPVTELAFTAG